MTNYIKDKLYANGNVVPFTMDDLVEYSGYKKSYLYKLVYLRQIPAHKRKHGRKLFFVKSEIDNWLLARTLLTIDEINSTN